MILPFPVPQRVQADAPALPEAGQLSRLATVIRTTQRMVQLAEAGAWDQVADLERERREELQCCFAAAVPDSHADLVAEALAAILHLNDELMEQLRAARDAVLELGVAQVRTRTALATYEALKASP